MVDGDHAYPTESARALCKPILTGEADITADDRLSNGTHAEDNKRAFHSLGNNLVCSMIKWLCSYSLVGAITGYRAMSKPFIKTFPALSEGFQVETELSIHAADHRWRIKDVPIAYRDRPIKFFSLVALIFAVIGLAMGIPIIMELLATGLVPLFHTAMLSAAFMFLCGLSLTTGFILDSVAKVDSKQWELRVNAESTD